MKLYAIYEHGWPACVSSDIEDIASYMGVKRSTALSRFGKCEMRRRGSRGVRGRRYYVFEDEPCSAR